MYNQEAIAAMPTSLQAQRQMCAEAATTHSIRHKAPHITRQSVRAAQNKLR